MSEQRAIQASLEAGAPPATVESLAADLRALGVAAGDVLMVHTAMSRLGYVVGGPQAVIEALLAAVGPEGTIAMPTFSGDRGDPAPWENPPVPASWWPLFRAQMPAFDPGRTPTRMMGAVAEGFRAWSGARRSNHPSSSIAALGPQAEVITAGHQLENGMG
ncbi:MAG: AAC(3) family N-acetyltransferase, partial [Planctomycetota bacterium]|nr:AAC(3) family N-acetyltransferase [Planctomycetota bacterium]